MLIADAQVHVWAASTPERPWVAGLKPQRPVPFSKDDLLREMDSAGVHRAVLVPPVVQGRNEVVLEAAEAHPDRFAVMGFLDIHAPSARDQLKTWRQQPGMLGLRFAGRENIQGDSSDWLWAEAAAVGVPIMLSVRQKQLPGIRLVAERHPKLKLVIDHLALPPDTKDEEAFAGLDQLLALADCPNIAVKASSLPSYTADGYPFRRLHPHIRRVYDAFGPRRMFWGTDFTRLPCTYREAITLFTEDLPWLTAEDKEWIMGRGLCEWIGWQMP